MASVSWQYPQDQLIALRRQNARPRPAAGRQRHRSLPRQLPLRVSGDRAPWRPLRAFDDGRQVFIEFPRGIGQGEMPPLFVVGPEGDTSELVNYRVRGNYMIVDRLFAAAELRFGAARIRSACASPAPTGGRREREHPERRKGASPMRPQPEATMTPGR
jgi:type IV secretion system protein VirB9